MKPLALLIDEIDNSKELIRFAALLGKDISAKLHVLYVQNPQVYGASSYMGASGATVAMYPSQLQNIANEVKEKAAGFIKEIKAEHHGIPSIEFKSEIGAASAILKEKVENNAYDMVMLQSHAEQSFLLQDSLIMDVVRNVPCPIWIIPPDSKYQPLNKIIYSTDHNEEDITTLKGLISLVKPFDPEIMALHISNDGDFENKLKSKGFAAMLSEKTGHNKVSVKMIADEDGKDAVESLINEAEKEKANLIVVLKENKNFFERLFKSSFTAELVKETQLPILVFHKSK
jgi:nucleotide-binding universal stress UspA family protein